MKLNNLSQAKIKQVLSQLSNRRASLAVKQEIKANTSKIASDCLSSEKKTKALVDKPNYLSQKLARELPIKSCNLRSSALRPKLSSSPHCCQLGNNKDSSEKILSVEQRSQ